MLDFLFNIYNCDYCNYCYNFNKYDKIYIYDDCGNIINSTFWLDYYEDDYDYNYNYNYNYSNNLSSIFKDQSRFYIHEHV